MMSCSSPICCGRRKERFLFVVVYLLVVFGFLKNAHILQQYKNNNYGVASSLFDNHNFPTPKPVVKKNGQLAPSVCDAFTTSVPIFWKQFETEIKVAAVSLATDYPEDQNNNTMFHDWIAQLFQDHYQSYQVRRSAIHPPGLEDTMKVLEIISKRVNYLRLDEETLADAADPAPPLHILVTGGSLTAGIECGRNPIGLNRHSNDWVVGYSKCAWPTRLEHLFNHVLFQGKEVVKVSNLAVGGSNSEIGTTVLEYQLFPDAFQLPDIVIWSHAANDAQENDKEKAYFESIPGYINAAHNLRMCDSNLPLVVMNEEFFTQNNDISGMIYKASNWFGLMGISHRNVISHKTFANFHNDEYIKSIIGAKGTHPGMAAHIGVAWTVFYNFISAFTDACDYKRVSSSPTVDSDGVGHYLFSNDVTAKSIGSYRENDYGEISSEWEKHQKTRLARCSGDDGNQKPCTFAFMVNKMTSIGTSAHVHKKMSEVLTSNTGWKAEGFPIKQPRAGFYAKEPNAHFSLKIDVSIETKYVTIMSMKSYGDNFKDTKLEVDVRIERKDEARTVSAADVAKYEVSGYHETTTSIHVPHKFELPNGGAKKGESIIVGFRLVSGSYFKIAGLAFCRY